MTLQTGIHLQLARWVAALGLAALAFIPVSAVAHPLHSQAIERPCAIQASGDDAVLIDGRCSFFLAAGYLVFQLDASADDADAQSSTISGAINLAQSTGTVSNAGGAQLASGEVKLAGQSPEIVHMEPGVLAAWTNGYVLKVGGSSVKADGPVGTLALNTTETVVEVFTNYLELGFLHIIPRGFDHILFIIGLFLLSPRLKALLWQVSAFTLAHTVTLALGATGVVRLPVEIVEPLIALSIVWIAVENLLTDRLHRWRIGVVFCFGLLHGLGFAGVLQEIGFVGGHFYSALLAFNLGVELGQLAVIALCFLIVGWAMRRPVYHGRIVVPASWVIALIGTLWVLERIPLT